ncbi:zinc finger protein swm isoform X3 [Pectinophora gossypiella]|uniref:zinc finger protein swm isoform X3 n=1 Tax=Pectinophora gossypiella TaxID=13191 RepID=UPI00214F3ACA|nr:zinc finger protein swm isoform X3 [Pectinophora gossypiella]
MIIENPDAFKSWLTSILEPLCDADPAALAKYVYALVKKDKPVAELREGMLDQLDVFLQQETRPFVDMLFKSLESQEYLKPQAGEKPPSPAPEAEPEKEPEVENHDQLESNIAAPLPPNGKEEVAEPPGARPRSPARHRVVLTRGGRPAPPRAPPLEHTLVKVLPLTELLEEPVDHPPRRRDRRGDSLRDKDDRRRRRSRSWERRARPRRHNREPHDDQRRRPLSRSPSPRGRYRNRSPPPTALERPPSRSRSRSPVPARDRDHDRERDRVRATRECDRERMSRDREHRDRVSRSRDRERSRERSRDRSLSPRLESRIEHNDGYNKRRCRDFDEKGYCMRGDLCQWDHGSDPVVLEDAALSRVLAAPPPVPEYNPLAPDIWCGAGFPPYPPPPPHAPRELIPIPRTFANRIRHDVPPPMGPTGPAMMPMPPRHPAPPKKNFDYNRLGPARPPPPPAAGNCSLEVKKVPRGLNDITHLNNHFSKFGKIVNIQVCYEGDPEGALITFSTPTEANVAYKSTEAVLNNRFIKVFWHNHENKQENMSPAGQPAGGERPSNQHPMSHNKVLINRDNIRATHDNKQQQLNIDKAKEQANGASEPVKKEVSLPAEKSKQVMEMHKRAQALLETQLQQQLLLIQRLEAGNVTGPQKAALMEAINSAQEGIEKLRKELVAYNKTLRQMQDECVARSLSRLQLAQAKKPKTREEAQKEILDAELDMFTKQQEGQDVTELAKKIAELRRQMAIQFPSHLTMRRQHSRGGRFNSATRFTRNTAKVFVNQVVDHRPRALLVSGFEPDDLTSLLQHFAQFGEITGKEVNLAVPELVIQYRARSNAEQAALRGRHYNDRTLSITWVTNNKPIGGGSGAPPAAVNGDTHDENKEVETPTELSEDALLRFDEEEDEDAEDRSWRR